MRSLLIVKLRRDLRVSWSRFALMVVALAVSLTVFGGILAARVAISSQTNAAYLSTEPASATIVLDKPVDAATMATITAEARNRSGVLSAAGRAQFDTTIEVNGQPRALPLQVFVATPDDPMRMVKFDLGQPGSWPPGDGDILLGRDNSLSLLGITVGDTLTVTTPAGEQVRLRVAGTVYDPSLAPSFQEQRGHGYLSTAALPTGAALDQVKIQVADPGQTVPSRDRSRIVDIASEVSAWLESAYGVSVSEIQAPKPYAHPHQWQSDVLLLALLVGAGAALLLATILVATMLNTLFTQQIPQIGIMKAIGARSVRIGRLYLAMTLLVAAIATLLALLPAVLIGRWGAEMLLGMLGIEPVSLAPAWWVYPVIVAVGMGLPPMMALLPLIKASRTTVRAAIDHHGGTTPSRASGLVARLSRLRRLDRGLLMALRNTVRRPARFWLSVGLLASAGMVFVAGMSLRSGTQAVDEQRSAQRYWDVEVQLAKPAAEDAIRQALRQVPGVDRIEAFTRAPVSIAAATQFPVTRTYPDQGHGSISVSTAGSTASTLLEGRQLDPKETGSVVLSQIVRDNTVPDYGAGDTVRLFIDGKPSTWRIAGIVEERDSTGGGVYTTAEGLADAIGQPPLVNQLRMITANHDEKTRQATADTVDTALTNTGIDVELAASVNRGTTAGSAHLGPVLLVLLGVALPLGLIGAIGLASTMSANILDRTREFGVLHAIGARPKTVRRIVVAEGVFLAVTSCLVAALPTVGLTWVLGAGLGNLFNNAALPLRVSALGVGIWLALVVLGAILATDAAATRASRLTVREALAYL